MTQENVDAIRQSFDLWTRGDFDAVTAALAPEVEWDLTHFTGWPDQSVYKGTEGLRAFWDAMREAWGEFRVEALRLEEVGDRVFAHGRFTGSGEQSGVPIRFEYGQVTTFDGDGKVVRNAIFMEVSEALEAAGLSE